MAFTIPNNPDAFNTHQAEIDKADIDILVAAFAGDGVISGCAVTAQGSPDMTVAVAAGQVQIGGVLATVSSGNVNIGAADGSNPRFDLITVNNSGTKACTAGTAAASPVFPTIPANSIVLAAVYVPTADTTIATNQITDKRCFVKSHVVASIWMPDAPPATAGAADDEYADASGGVPSGWTEVDHGTGLTVTEDEAGLKLASTAAQGNAGIYKAIPAGDFTVWTKVALSAVGLTDFMPGGLVLWEDAANSAGDLRVFYMEASAADVKVIIQAWTAYNAFGSSVASFSISVDTLPAHVYLRIRRTGTTYAFDVSLDGLGWFRIHNTAALGITPTHVGPAINTSSHASGSLVGRFSFFRYVASDVGIGGLMEGDRLKVLRS